MESYTTDDGEQVDLCQYLEYFYESPDTVERQVKVKFILDSLHDAFSEGGGDGQSLLDIGSGSCLHTIISAANVVENLYLTDNSDQNIKFLNSWWKGDRVIQPRNIEYVLEKEGKCQTFEERNSNLKTKVKNISRVDITSVDPLQEVLSSTGYDIITSSFCLEHACKTPEQYSKCMKTIYKLLKNGGQFVLVGNLRKSSIDFEDKKIRIMDMDRKYVHDLFETCGFEIKVWKELLQSSTDDDFSGSSIFMTVAEKSNEC